MSNEFKWSESYDCIVFPTVQGVAVYRIDDDSVVIRQEGEPGDDDSFVIVPRKNLKSLIDALESELT